MSARRLSRRRFLEFSGSAAAALALPARSQVPPTAPPNILLAIADDWSWPHAGIAGDPVVLTPAFDRVAREGVLFDNAFVSSPSCTPSRGALLTGQWHWRLEEGANLWSVLPAKFAVYPDLLEAAGYVVGKTRKGWGPGNDTGGGRSRNAAGPNFPSFADFLAKRPAGKPFCFWLGSNDPHRPYKKGSGVEAGLDPDAVRVPGCLPDTPEVRSDICDYYVRVTRFDSDVAEALRLLGEAGELDNTLVAVTSDNGMPFPRCKSNIHDGGTHVPLAIRWGARVPGGARVQDFVSLTDLAPTFLEAAGLPVPREMTGGSLVGILAAGKSGRVDPAREAVLVGKERHTCAQQGTTEGYPCRGLRTEEFLYIVNFHPERWPAGTPPTCRDIDGSPTKSLLLDRGDDPAIRPFLELASAKRPAEELYDLKKDPDQLHNVAEDPAYAEVKRMLRPRLVGVLRDSGDPRITGGGEAFDTYPYVGRGAGKPAVAPKAKPQ